MAWRWVNLYMTGAALDVAAIAAAVDLGDAAELSTEVTSRVVYGVTADPTARWRRIYVPGIGPDGGRLESVAEYIPSLNQVLFIYKPNRTKVWLYDLASDSWVDPGAQPMPVSVYSAIGCYDSKRDRVLILAGHTFVAYNVAAKTWTATGDDGNTGRATRYEIRCATEPITGTNWADAVIAANPPGPQEASSTESFWVTGLEPATTYYFALKVYDEEPNESGLSNVVQGSTLADTMPPTIVSVSAAGPSTQVKVVFSEPVDPVTAEDVGNYTIEGPTTLSVLDAVLEEDNRTVTLTTSAMANGGTYTLTVSNVTDRAQGPNPIAPGTQVQFTCVASVLLVDFGPAAGTDTYGLAGWNTKITDICTKSSPAGPGGTSNYNDGNATDCNFQGVTSATPRTFAAGEKIVVTWYNNHPTSTFTFTPRISFDDPNRVGSAWPPVGTWYLMTPIALAPGQTGTTEYVLTETTAGNYSLVNVNRNYHFAAAYAMICDRIELLGIAPLLGDIDGDGHVNVFDIFVLAENWNR